VSETVRTNTATRAEFVVDGRRLSYLDFGGPGRPLVALHGHLSEAATCTALAEALRPQWRLIAPDQRGHGESDRAADYSREGYLGDLQALLDHLALERIVLLGHSLGAINAYQFAARRPERVDALVDAEGPAALGLEGANPLGFLLNLPYRAPSREALVTGLGPAASYFADRLREDADGSWRLPFHPQDMYDSEEQVHGDHWADWTATSCPALLVHGTDGVIATEQVRAMVERRANTRAVELNADHFVYTNAPEAFTAAVRDFLATV
jgi:pimeloyl-ACP methyl ester carboxylesterase